MGIRFQCEHCQTRLNVKSHQAGKQGRCPKCGSAILIPSQSTLNAPSSAPSPVGTEQATLNFSKTELLRPEDVGGTVVETRPAPVDNFSVAEDTNSNASDDSIALTTSPTPPMADPDSFLLGKPKNKALLPDGPDPIQEDPRKVWYIRNHKHSEIGPIPGSQLQQMLDDKKVLPGSYLWREDWEDWEKGEAIFSSLGNLSDSPSDVAKKSNVRSQAGLGRNLWLILLVAIVLVALFVLILVQVFS